MWALTTRYATLADSFRHFSYRPVKGLDSYHYSNQELKHCVIHYSVSEFILSEVNQELLVRISGLTGSKFTTTTRSAADRLGLSPSPPARCSSLPSFLLALYLSLVSRGASRCVPAGILPISTPSHTPSGLPPDLHPDWPRRAPPLHSHRTSSLVDARTPILSPLSSLQQARF